MRTYRREPGNGSKPRIARRAHLGLLAAVVLLAASACNDGGAPQGETPSATAAPSQSETPSATAVAPTAVTPTAAGEPSPSATEGTLALVAESASAEQGVYLLDAEGGEPRLLIAQEAGWPRWSPDGQHLAFLGPASQSLPEGAGAGAELFVINADGTELRTVAVVGGLRSYSAGMAWSPDGRTIAFESTSRSDEVTTGIEVVDVDSADTTELAPGHPGFMPTWSPDGSRIAFVSHEGKASADVDVDIYVMDADGSNVHRLVKNEGADVAPTWSPDGRRIAWWVRSAEGPPHHLFVSDVEEPEARELGTGSRPAWSPDSKSLAFLDQAEDGNIEVFVLDVDSDQRVSVTADPAQDVWLAWSPYARQIVFVSKRDNEQGEIYVVDADGANLRRLTNNDLAETMLDWSPP